MRMQIARFIFVYAFGIHYMAHLMTMKSCIWHSYMVTEIDEAHCCMSLFKLMDICALGPRTESLGSKLSFNPLIVNFHVNERKTKDLRTRKYIST